MTAAEVPSSQSESERFYGAALGRIRRFLLALSFFGFVVCLVKFGLIASAGFLLGAIVSYINHVWLERVVSALGERITSGQSRERGAGIVARAVLRYAFIAVGAYIIFRVSLTGLYGFLAGICLTIGAIACEAAVEIYVGLRRGM